MDIQQASHVRKHFQEAIDHVHYTKMPLIISKNGKPWVIVQPLPEEDETVKNMIRNTPHAQ